MSPESSPLGSPPPSRAASWARGLPCSRRGIVEDRTVRIIDLAFVRKDADGTAAEIPDSEVAAAFSGLHNEQNDLLSDEEL
jgi:hypothetical protein